MYLLYRIAAYLAAPLYLGGLLQRMATRPGYGGALRQRLGFGLPRFEAPTVWVHAVSVGEVEAALPLLARLADTGKPLVLSVTTPTGREVAMNKAADLATVVPFVADLPGAVRRACDALNPALLVTVDTEIWPTLFDEVARRGRKVAMVNGRISDRSYPRYRRLRPFFAQVLDRASLLLMQDQRDAERIVKCGADPARVEVAGNLKYDRSATPLSANERATLRAELGIGPEETVLMIGSIHEGEGEALDAAARVARERGVRLFVAPRRIENVDWIATVLGRHGMTLHRRSAAGGPMPHEKTSVPVLDTFGELARCYGVADLALVGGSFNDHGGQNPLEPAAHGVPMLFGPSMSNFAPAARGLVEGEGGVQVDDASALADAVAALLADPAERTRRGEAARAFVERNRGAADRIAARLKELLDD